MQCRWNTRKVSWYCVQHYYCSVVVLKKIILYDNNDKDIIGAIINEIKEVVLKVIIMNNIK